jgi:hypothetical protein
MAFTRFKYDDCRTKKSLQQATDPGRWILNVPGNVSWKEYWTDVINRTTAKLRVAIVLNRHNVDEILDLIMYIQDIFSLKIDKINYLFYNLYVSSQLSFSNY